MEPDTYQQAWQTQASQTRVTVDADLLLKEVQRNQRDFRATILRRDVIEVGVGLLLLPYWLYKGATSSLPWTWYLTVPAIIWLLGVFAVDRLRHPQSPSDPGEPLLSCVKNSLAQIEHQIFLPRNVFWWYLLPFTISIQTFFAHNAWLKSDSSIEAFSTATPYFLFLVALYSFIDYLNQRGIRRELEPRRQELLQLLASLDSDDSLQQHVVAGRTSSITNGRLLRRWLIVTVVSYVLFGVFVLTAGKIVSSYNGPPRSSGPAASNSSSPSGK